MKHYIIALFILTASLSARADFFDLFRVNKTGTNQTTSVTNLNLSNLSQEQVTQGLKQALSNGLQNAVQQLGRTNGFLTNANVRIPMPEKLLTVERTLRSLKQDKLADDFILTMNRAAEEAVPVAAGVFVDSVKQLSMEDAKAILLSTNDAATQFFRRTTQSNLTEKFLPIVKRATENNNVTASYKKLLQASTTSASTTNNLGSALGSLLNKGEALLAKNAVDVDTYVTEKALDGLFKMIAEEERKIRENPTARSTDLLKKVFGAIQK